MMTVLSVSKLNFYLRALMEGDAPLQNLYVSGEISNFKRYPTSGHCYFTLRDEKAQLECGLFAGKLQGLDCVSFGPDMDDIHTPKESMNVDSVRRTWDYVIEILRRLR